MAFLTVRCKGFSPARERYSANAAVNYPARALVVIRAVFISRCLNLIREGFELICGSGQMMRKYFTCDNCERGLPVLLQADIKYLKVFSCDVAVSAISDFKAIHLFINGLICNYFEDFPIQLSLPSW